MSTAEEFTGTVRIGSIDVQIIKGHGVLPKGTAVAAPGRSKRPRKPAAASVQVKSIKDAGAYGPEAVARRVVEALGNNVTAKLLGVSQDGPGRWATGVDRPSETNRAKLADLDTLLGHLLATFTPEQAALWLEGQDPFLRARPIDVFTQDGPGRLIDAMKAYAQGAFA